MTELEADPAYDDKAPLVKPTGHHLMVMLYREPEQTEGGVWKPDALIDRESVASIIGYVVAVGPDAYVDMPGRKWPSGPMCQQDDFVLFRSYAGTRFRVAGSKEEFRMIPDDAVEGVVSDPTKVKRA